MAKIEPFEKYIDQYEDWFVQNRYAYQSEINAVRPHLPGRGWGFEIGVGSGLFAEPLGIHFGVEPSKKMRVLATRRGVTVVEGVAEDLPLENNFYDFALMVTTICFLDDVQKSLTEAHRVIKPGGKLIIGFIDKNSPVGKLYQKYKQENVFYRVAEFYSVDEVTNYMITAGFSNLQYTQSIFRMLDEIQKAEKVKTGYGEGSFVVVSGEKNS